MKKPWRSIWFMPLTALLFFGAAFVTLRAAGQAAERSPTVAAASATSPAVANALAPPSVPTAVNALAPSSAAAAANALAPSSARFAAPAPPSHPPPSAPEESATIADDPTTAPDASQSADNNVSFPTDI
jgi:hypothetical protein